MLFDLFPRFWDAVKQSDQRHGVASRSKLTEATTLKEVLKANDLEIHLFAEYCREHMCEDSVIFLLECQTYSLLFDPSDLLAQGKRIYETYIDGGSEGRNDTNGIEQIFEGINRDLVTFVIVVKIMKYHIP